MRRLDEALRPGGLTYLPDGTPVDAHGNVLEGAPARPDNTKPEDMPHNRMAQAGLAPASGTAAPAFDMRALGTAIADGLKMAASNADATRSNAEQADALADGAEDATIKPDTAPIVPASATAELNNGLIVDGKPDPERSGQAALSAAAATTGGLRATGSTSGASDTGSGTSTAADAGTSGVQSSSTGAAPSGAPGTSSSKK